MNGITKNQVGTVAADAQDAGWARTSTDGDYLRFELAYSRTAVLRVSIVSIPGGRFSAEFSTRRRQGGWDQIEVSGDLERICRWLEFGYDA